jgi:hypothetical protein
MKSKIDREDLEIIAARAVESLEDLIKVMQDAANQISCGRALEEVDVDYEEYLCILDRVAREGGLCLDEQTELEVTLSEMEFGEDLVTGGFGNFKGVSVAQHNDCLLRLMDAVSSLLERSGMNVVCIPDEDVIFYLPIG